MRSEVSEYQRNWASSKNTLYGWMRKERQGAIDLDPGNRSLDNALTLS